jgi:NADPH:quinone reductase-like Zn-dependent oxidoreductase
VRRGVLRVVVARSYPLREAAAAHRDVEGRGFPGAIVLVP